MNPTLRAPTRARTATTAGLIYLCGVSMMAISAALSGCTPPPPRVPIPAQPTAQYGEGPVAKPLPPQPQPEIVMPFDDPPLISQQTPEQPAFVDAYRRVGSPRITLFVNRTLEGNIVPVNSNDPIARAEVRTHETGGNKPPRDYRGTATIYLQRGQYDEADARALDYQAIETIMTDWLACGGNVTIISPTLARQRLSDQQVRELQEGRPTALSEVAQQLGADILVQVQAHPTRQTDQGLEVRIIAEAMNTRGGQSIGRAVVDIPPPLQKTTINRATRFMARKLMDDMMAAWSAPPPPAPPPTPPPSAPPPGAPPAAAPMPAPVPAPAMQDNSPRQMLPATVQSPPATQP